MSLCFCVAWLINLCKIWARIELIRCTRSIVALTHTTHRLSDCALFNFRWFVACVCVCICLYMHGAHTFFVTLFQWLYLLCSLYVIGSYALHSRWTVVFVSIIQFIWSAWSFCFFFSSSFLKNKTSTPVVSKNIISHKFAIKKKMRDTASKIALKNAYTTHIHLGYELIF